MPAPLLVRKNLPSTRSYCSLLQSLPVELRLRIASFCDGDSLASLALVHTSWTAPCEEHLYLQVAFDLDCRAPERDSTPLFLRTVTNVRGKAALVRTLDVDLATWWLSAPSASQVTHMMTAFCAALAHMRHLRYLLVPVAYPAVLDAVAQLMLDGVFRLRGLKLSMTVVYALCAGTAAQFERGILSQEGTLRAVVMQGDLHGPAHHTLARLSAVFSVFATGYRSHFVSVWPSLYHEDPERYVADVRSALDMPFFVSLPLQVEHLEVSLHVEKLSSAARILLSLGPVTALLLQMTFFLETGAASGATALTDDDTVFSAIAPVIGHLESLMFSYDSTSRLTSSAPAVFAEHLAARGCGHLSRIQLPYGRVSRVRADDRWVFRASNWDDTSDEDSVGP